MLTRRFVIGLAASSAAWAFAGAAEAQSYKSTYKELVWAVIPAENASGVTERYKPLMDYLSKELGIPVTLRVASAYAAVIEGQKAGNIHVGMYGPASYARAYATGVPTEPFAMDVNKDGTKGYHSVLYVKKDSSFQSIQDLKGKNLGLVDPNSTSGNNVPRFAMDKMGIKPDEFFAKVVYTGSHENAITGLTQGTIDAAFNWWNDENESNLRRMERKGLAKYDDFRIIFKSDQIVNSPIAYLKSLPDDLKKAIRDAVFSFATKDPEGFQKATDGQAQPWAPATHKDYEPVVELIKFVDSLRKKS
jgi:phosphonate transport system substrate-binding protein